MAKLLRPERTVKSRARILKSATSMETDLQHIGQRLQQLRHEHGLTLQELAGHCGFSTGYLSQIETGTAVPSLTALQVIAADLGVEVADFFPEEHRHGTRLIRAADRHEFRLEQGSGEVYAVLAGQVADRAFSALYARHLPANGGSKRPFRHLREEFSLILSGTLELTIEGETYERVTGTLCQRLSHVAASHRRWAGAGRGATASRSRERSRPGFRAELARECARRRPRDCRSSGWRARTEPAALNGEMPFQVAVIQFAGARSRVTRSVAPGLIGAVRRCGRWEAIISAAASSNVSLAPPLPCGGGRQPPCTQPAAPLSSRAHRACAPWST